MPATLGQKPLLPVPARLVSAVRVAFDYEISGPSAIVATGHTVHATLDRQGRPVRVPARIKELIR